MSRGFFETDGIRGLAGTYPLDGAGAMEIGQAVGEHFAGQPGDTILIAGDTRASTDHLKLALSTGLTAVGAEVVDAGVLPTPGLAYVTRESERAVAGVVITASHNPSEYNGIKIVDAEGGKLSDETERDINRLLTENRASCPSTEQRFGSYQQAPEAFADKYKGFLMDSIDDTGILRPFVGMKIGVDAANGAASFLAPQVLRGLGANVISCADEPDGSNINQQCGATHTEDLQELVRDLNLDAGIALDGDADRVVLIDELGRPFNGDHVLYTLAVINGYRKVVATVMTNLGTERALQEQGIDLHRTQVGDRYVLDGLRKTGAKVGGEQSGHIILRDFLATGDGMLAAIQTLRAVRASGRFLAEWRDAVPQVPQHLLNIAVGDKTLLNHERVTEYVASLEERLGGAGRVLIRPSGTEPVARVMVEVEASDAERITREAAAGLEQILDDLAA